MMSICACAALIGLRRLSDESWATQRFHRTPAGRTTSVRRSRQPRTELNVSSSTRSSSLRKNRARSKPSWTAKPSPEPAERAHGPSRHADCV